MSRFAMILISIFLIGMGMGAFAEAVASHDAGSIWIELPSGTVVPLHSVVEPTEFKSIHVKGWVETRSDGSRDVEIYYSFMINHENKTRWVKVREITVEPGERKEFEFTIDNNTVANVLAGTKLDEAVVSVLVSVSEKGKEPKAFVVAGVFDAIDMCKKINEDAKEEELEAHSDVVQEVANELGVSVDKAKELLKNSDGRAVRKYAEVKKRMRKKNWKEAPKHRYDPDKYIKLWCGSSPSCIKEVKEALASGTTKTISVKGYTVCGEIKVGDELSYPRVICTKPGKKVLVKRALARRMSKSYSSGNVDTGVNVGGAENEIKELADKRVVMASIIQQKLAFGSEVNIDWPTLIISSALVIAGLAIAGRVRR